MMYKYDISELDGIELRNMVKSVLSAGLVTAPQKRK
jgi:hypothetical protein